MADDKKPDDQLEDKNDKKGNEADESGLTPEQIASAKSLYKALSDDSTSTELIETLARRAGLLDKKGEPKDDKKSTETQLKRLTAKLKKGLGKDYDTFSDKVGPLIDEAIEEYLEEHFAKTDRKQSGDSWTAAVTKFQETHELTNKIENKMTELMEEAPPNLKRDGFNAQKYLTRMYNSALAELGEKPTEKTKSGKEEFPDFEVRSVRGKTVTLDDAIDAAMKGIRFKHE